MPLGIDLPNKHSNTCNLVLTSGLSDCNCVFKTENNATDYMSITSPSELGVKHDLNKCRLDLIPIDALWELGRVYTKGAIKYADWNWSKGLKYSRVYAALLRHLFTWWWAKEQNDPETTCHHLASVAWAAFTLMHYDMNYEMYKNYDNRPNVGDGGKLE